jgi:hypothetical protein
MQVQQAESIALHSDGAAPEVTSHIDLNFYINALQYPRSSDFHLNCISIPFNHFSVRIISIFIMKYIVVYK